jgi:site-specific recombinase XerD
MNIPIHFNAALADFLADTQKKVLPSTYRAIASKGRTLSQYLSDKPYSFDAIDVSFMYNYENWLLYQRKHATNTANRHLKFVKQVLFFAEKKYNIATQSHRLRNNRDKATTPRPLHSTERQALEQTVFFGNIQKAVDYFLMSCETGLHYADLCSLRPIHFFEHKYIKKSRQKTGIEAIVPLSPFGLKLAKKYNFYFKKIHNPELNLLLKQAAAIAGIRADLRISDGRDCFADYWGNVRRIALDDLAIMMGMASTKELKKYLKIREQRILDNPDLWA